MVLNVQDVKNAANGRWREILSAVGGIDVDLLDGRHHPCPRCGGTNRFRLVDESAGAVLCNKCFSERNGDSLAALIWLNGWTFPEALNRTTAHLGLTSHGNGRLPPQDALKRLAVEKRVPPESLNAYGATVEGNRVVVPMFGPDGQQCSSFSMKPGGGKGLCAAGKPAGVFLPVVDGVVRLPKPGETWIVVEGPKDAAALHALGYFAAGLPTKQMNVKFARLFAGVHVVIVPDRDLDGEKGAQKTAAHLRGGAASVRVGTLPAEFTESNGADVRDVLPKLDGEKLVRQAIEDAVEWRPAPQNKSKRDSLVPTLAGIICRENHFAQDRGLKLYRYRDGAYRSHADEFIRAQVKALCEGRGASGEWSTHLANEIVEYIRVDAPELWERPPSDVLNTKNGLLEVGTRTLRPHSPEWLSLVQIPVAYEPHATCPKIDNFIDEVFPADNPTLAYEIVSWLMLPDGSIQKAVLLLGPGGNGKSRYLCMVVSFLGKANVSSLSLHRLESNPFACARLYGKLANICPDLPSEHLAGTSIFKAITGGDRIVGEHKFLTSFDFEPFCGLLFSANNPPRAKDSSEGFFDRWEACPFERRFRGTDIEIPSAKLDAMLSHPRELSGLLNRALDVLPGLRERGRFTSSDSTKEAFSEFRATTDPFAVWLDAHTVEEPGAVTLQASMHAAYARYCESKGVSAMTKTAFGLALKRERPEPRVTVGQRTVAGKKGWCYLGIGLRSDQPPDGASQVGNEVLPSHEVNEVDPSLCYARASEVVDEGRVEKERSRTRGVNSVNPVTSVTGPCHHEPQERITFDGWSRTECALCGEILQPDRHVGGVPA